jgi:hypothetical protein
MEGKVCQNSKCTYSLCSFFMVKINKRVKGRNLERGAGREETEAWTLSKT